MEVAIIGAGGIAYHLWEDVVRLLFTLDESSSLYIIDGDTIEATNLSRQFFPAAIGKNKAEMIAEMAKTRFGDNHISIHAVPEFLNRGNLQMHRSLWIDRCSLFLGCVDNNQTRVFIEEEVACKRDAIYVVGGNDKYEGQAQAFVRKGGRNLLPKITHIAPEILADKAPLPGDGTGCLVSGPQTALANKAAAMAMEMLVHHLLKRTKPSMNEIRVDTRTGKMTPLLQKSLVLKGKKRGNQQIHHDREGAEQRHRRHDRTDRTRTS